jgi:hypothetical protein
MLLIICTFGVLVKMGGLVASVLICYYFFKRQFERIKN